MLPQNIFDNLRVLRRGKYVFGDFENKAISFFRGISLNQMHMITEQ